MIPIPSISFESTPPHSSVELSIAEWNPSSMRVASSFRLAMLKAHVIESLLLAFDVYMSRVQNSNFDYPTAIWSRDPIVFLLSSKLMSSFNSDS